jgi:hypothetical protein
LGHGVTPGCRLAQADSSMRVTFFSASRSAAVLLRRFCMFASSLTNLIHRLIRASLPQPSRSSSSFSFPTSPPPLGAAVAALFSRSRAFRISAFPRLATCRGLSTFFGGGIVSFCGKHVLFDMLKPPKTYANNISRGGQGHPGGPNGPAVVL